MSIATTLRTTRALVWFKRDLRVLDHAPLLAALSHADGLAVFVIEPEWLQSPECDARHVDFVLVSLAELRAALAQRGMPLIVRVGTVVKVLAKLHKEFGFSHLLSHEETGTGWSYLRDKQVATWCQTAQVTWEEFPQSGVIRRLGNRSGWAKRWKQRMDMPQCRLSFNFVPAAPIDQPHLPTMVSLGLMSQTRARQPGGEMAAHQTLWSFLNQRALDYRKSISSPLSAELGCSRLSPHLAFGTISMRTVYQATEDVIAKTPVRGLAYSLRGFAGRLRWHCHFMQKLEDEPEIEFRNFARGYDGLREDHFNQAYFDAWSEGRTGYPMVDACMRSLLATGWLNFRMRAMLVSFASYQLWLHWRPTGLFLARQFLDFEPGIHWCQMQMQSGTTGINTLRMYSPTKQARDQDPHGVFIRRWLPELSRVPLPYLAEPWTMDASVQRVSRCMIGLDYPSPIVDERLAIKLAKDRMYGLRKTAKAIAEANQVQDRHGSRKSGLIPTARLRRTTGPPSQKHLSNVASSPNGQGDLFA